MFFAVLIVLAGLSSEPVHQTLSASYDVWDVTAKDLNDDGRLDLIALYGERDSFGDKKGLYVYIAKPKGGYTKKPTIDFLLGQTTGDAFFTKRDGRSQLVVTTEEGATVYRYEDNTFVVSKKYASSTLLPTHTREPKFMRNISFDLDGDNSDEWILPVLNGFDIWSQAGKRTQLKADIFSESYSYAGYNVMHRLPSVYIFDRVEDSNSVIGFVGERGAIFHYGNNWKVSRRYDLPEPTKEQWDRQATLADINNDGFPDLMVSNTKGTANIEVRIEIFLASAELKYPKKPSFEYTTKGGLATPVLIDLNNDEKLDIVVRGFSINLRNIASYLFRNKISMKLETHLFKGGAFSKKPTYTNQITSEVSEGREEILHAYGDFDGDGMKDIAIGGQSARLTILTHVKNGSISTRPWKTIDVHTFGIARIADLDSNGRDDIVIYHPRGEHQKEIDIIRF